MSEEIPGDPEELSRWLKRETNLRYDICKLLRANNIGGKMLAQLNRDDLKDLLPNDFLARKQLWDVIKNLKHSPVEIVDKQEELIGDDELEDSFECSQRVQTQKQSPPLVIPSLKRERSLSPSTMSVDSEYQSDSSFGFDTPRPSTDKHAKYSNNKWDNFTFPSPPGLQNNKDIPDSIRKQVIRDVYTCMRAQCQGEKISSQDFVMVAKKVCRKIPQLKDQEPVGLKLRADFAYYGTVLYLLRKRHSNMKRTNTEDVQEKPKSKKGKRPAELEPSPNDIEKHHKQIMLELRKEPANQEAVKKLQELSFTSRVEDIGSNFKGPGVVSDVCQKYPFLQLEQQLLHELALHVSKVTGEDASVEAFQSKWEKLLPYLCEEETPQEFMPQSGITKIYSFFADCPSIVFCVDQTSGDVDEMIKKEVKSNAARLVAFEPSENDATASISQDSGQLFVVVDKTIFLEIEGNLDYSKGLLLLLATYYCFNLQYDNKEKLLYQFLEEFVLGVKPLRRTFKYRQVCNQIFKKQKA